ncbi:DUF3939 domain-containing protein [Paenibacillus sp. sptzw28]|uniref:DUF3939 domain-containing protein n=1 Tax=Paenibacillus sp. sptzw28 TaxID=715179 RepID=UPI001C6E3E8E|nr:DUF3939 domain-containing protein [Paenibacillus sp. sptzw28]QYR19917.1 DUF3939 domain-containing protein [Paenibacillus sp. sptzw28]
MTINWMKNAASAFIIMLLAVVLPGCMYPNDQPGQNQRPPKDAILNVQAVIDQYKKDTGLLPIRNSNPDTPLYEKYQIDFDKLLRMDYLSEIPATAYEKGGSYYYLIINEETDPTVKLMNLAIYQQVNDIQAALKVYSGSHGGDLPSGETAYPGFTRIDYSKLDKREPAIRSMYTGQTLSTMMDGKGNVYIDYGSDIMQALAKQPGGLKPDQDLRALLVDHSDFVPVKSTVYRLVNGEPQAVFK